MFAPDSATEKIVAEVVKLAGPSGAQGIASANIAAFGQTTGDVGAMLVMADPAVVCATTSQPLAIAVQCLKI